MRNIFELTKREQQIIIAIVIALVVFAFAKHAWETRSATPAPLRSTSSPTPAPTVHPEDEQSEPNDSR